LAYQTFEDWGRLADASAQPLPIVVAVYTPAAALAFLRGLLVRDEDDEDWDLPDSVKNSVLCDDTAAEGPK
jgi:hypothetical protein